MGTDILWIQRFQNFNKAFQHLENAFELSKTKELTELEKQGFIQSFEFTHELAWSVLKDYFAHQGNPDITGSRDAFREAFQKGLVENGEVWMEMITSRNLSSHTYNQAVSEEIIHKIKLHFIPAFLEFKIKMTSLSKIESN